MTLIAILADREGIDLAGMHFRIEKHMNATPRRIGKLPITIHLPAHIQADKREKVERAALTCPVHHSLHPDIEIPVEFLYDV
mgnify:CR=1 FL=1